MPQHSELTPERWARFSLDQQILQIGAEMHRASASMARGDGPALRNGYERVLRLVDLTAQVTPGLSRRRELLRWRDLIAELYLAQRPDEAAHRAAFRVLLLMRPETAKHIPDLLGPDPRPMDPLDPGLDPTPQPAPSPCDS